MKDFSCASGGFRQPLKCCKGLVGAQGQHAVIEMIHETVFDPTDLKALGMVFDETWHSLVTEHPEFGTEMRLRLATLLLGLAKDHQLGPHQLKAIAIRLMDHGYPKFVFAG